MVRVEVGGMVTNGGEEGIGEGGMREGGMVTRGVATPREVVVNGTAS